MNVLNAGFVELIEAPTNGDLAVVNGMLVSTGKNTETEMTEANERRINFLMSADPPHASPFEHAQFRFYVKAPIHVAREWFRHRTASFNEMSGRYKKLEPDFFVPADDAWRTQKGKPGAYTFEPLDDPMTNWLSMTELEKHYDASVQLYERLLDRGVAKEQARVVLPQGMYTEFYFTINPRNLMNFLRLRNSDQAMYEIRVYAAEIEKMLATAMPVCYDSWVRNGRKQI